MQKKYIGIIVLLVIAIIAIAICFNKTNEKPAIYIPREVKINGVYLGNSKAIQEFKLMDHRGQPFSNNNLIGRWTMMFFGFTNCGHVCPTTMTELNHMYKKLETELPKEKLPQIILVTVDPERDSISRLNEYVHAFNKNFIGARAELMETEALEKQLHISAIKVEAPGKSGQYVINHSAEILLFNPQGQLQAYLSFPSKADQLEKDYKMILSLQVS